MAEPEPEAHPETAASTEELQPPSAAEKGNHGLPHLVSATSADAFVRGVALGRECAEVALELHALLAGVWFGHLTDEWRSIADSSLCALEAHAPISVRELRGFASVLDERGGGSPSTPHCSSITDGMRLLLMLGSERELGMLNAQRGAGFKSPPLGGAPSGTADGLSSPQDCSGLVWSDPGADSPRSVLGHATDLTPEFYLDGRATRVCHLAGGSELDSTDGEVYPACLCINFAGVGCIGGTNSCGLTISRFTVDTGERNLNGGVPIYYLVREALTRRTLEGAVEYLRRCPRTLPYAFHLAQCGMAVGVECSPSAFTVRAVGTGPGVPSGSAKDNPVTAWDTNYHGVRANHCILDPDMIRTEIGAHHLAALGGQNDKSSAARQASLEHALTSIIDRRKGAGPNVPDVQAALLESPITNETTMFCFVAESQAQGASDETKEERTKQQRALGTQLLHVQFFGEGPEFHTYSVS